MAWIGVASVSSATGVPTLQMAWSTCRWRMFMHTRSCGPRNEQGNVGRQNGTYDPHAFRSSRVYVGVLCVLLR
ncbi:hypothetical protein BJV78DRAFT_951474 [Lactifluus subvellereus]|nr:hypothetical protein BJV78DRAFT_951474 [Lactifluus subvellereus]